MRFLSSNLPIHMDNHTWSLPVYDVNFDSCHYLRNGQAYCMFTITACVCHSAVFPSRGPELRMSRWEMLVAQCRWVHGRRGWNVKLPSRSHARSLRLGPFGPLTLQKLSPPPAAILLSNAPGRKSKAAGPANRIPHFLQRQRASSTKGCDWLGRSCLFMVT